MTEATKVLMEYLYRQNEKEKCVTLSSVYEWTRNGKYRHRVEAIRGMEEIAIAGGMAAGTLTAEDLPRVMPAIGEKGAYTGLVMLSFRTEGGVEQH